MQAEPTPAPSPSPTPSRAALYRGRRMIAAAGAVLVSVADDARGARWRPLTRRADLVNHSPNGFEWGYGGSGPADLALAILADHFARFPEDRTVALAALRTEPGADVPPGDELAVRLHHTFKFAVIATMPQGARIWVITSAIVRAFLAFLACTDEGAKAPFAYFVNVDPGAEKPAETCHGCGAEMHRLDATTRKCRTDGCTWFEALSPAAEWQVIDSSTITPGAADGAELRPPAVELPVSAERSRHMLAPFLGVLARLIAAGVKIPPRLEIMTAPGEGWAFEFFKAEDRARMDTVFGAEVVRALFGGWQERFGADKLRALFGDWPEGIADAKAAP